MSCNEIEEDFLFIDTMLNSIINKLDNYKNNDEKIFFNNKIKENMLILFSSLVISKELLYNTLYEIRINNCLHNLHNYIDDFIDINPELSQKITYCKNCGIEKMQ